jgi:hypothetical protein
VIHALKFFFKFGIELVELFEVEFDSSLLNAEGSQIILLHHAVGSQVSSLHIAAGSQISLLKNAAGSQVPAA